MDVDKMFKLPALPASAGQKRKFTDTPTPELLKRYRPSEAEVQMRPLPPVTNGKGIARAATVEDEGPDSREASGKRYQDEAQAEPADVVEDDEDGRFFGGGINDQQNQILDIFGQTVEDEEPSATMSLPALRRQMGRFQQIVAKNAEQRGKYPDDPSRFIESEADLDSALKQLLPLTQNPPHFYPELVKGGTILQLTSLLSHENADIAMDAIQVIQELTDEDVGAEADDLAADEAGGSSGGGMAARTARVMADLIDELLNDSILDLLVSNLARLNEAEDADRDGVFQILGTFENMLSFMPPLADQIVAETSLLSWLLKRVAQEEYDSNKQYASEILAILLQQSRDNVMKLNESDGVEALLQILSRYRKKDPGDSEEVEFMENIFNCLCTALAQPESKQMFLEAEGVELMIIMMKEKSLLARTRAIKVLNYAMQTEAGAVNCERFVEMLGLKTFFSAFMGKGDAKRRKVGATSFFEDEEHLLGILVSLFTNLASDTPPRIRLIAKSVEGDYEKVDRLLEMREFAESRSRPVDRDIADERLMIQANGEEISEEEEADWYTRRTEAGLSSLQNADYVLAWMCMEDDGALSHARTLLKRKGQSFQDVITVLDEFRDNVGDEPEVGEDGELLEAPNLQRMVIEQLVAFLGSAL